jgi:hypothetical protein
MGNRSRWLRYTWNHKDPHLHSEAIQHKYGIHIEENAVGERRIADRYRRFGSAVRHVMIVVVRRVDDRDNLLAIGPRCTVRQRVSLSGGA